VIQCTIKVHSCAVTLTDVSSAVPSVAAVRQIFVCATHHDYVIVALITMYQPSSRKTVSLFVPSPIILA